MKKRISALVMCLVMLVTMFPFSVFATDGNEGVCESCGGTPCICGVWESVAEAEDVCLIGYLNKEAEIVGFFNDVPQTTAIPADECPDYLILSVAYNSKENGAPIFYMADSFDDDFYEAVLSYYPYITEDMLSAVVPAEGLYATVGGEGNKVLYADPEDAASAVTVDASALTGEYMVSEFRYDVEDAGNWFFKLTPDSGWPASAQGFLWINSGDIAKLSRTASVQPEVLVYTGTLNGKEISVSGELPVSGSLAASVVDNGSDILAELGIDGGFVADIQVLDTEGEPWQPERGETVQIAIPVSNDLAGEETVDVVHFLEDGEKIRELLEMDADVEIVEVPEPLQEVLAPAIAGYREAMEGTQELTDDAESQKAAVELFENVPVVDGVVQVESCGFSAYSVTVHGFINKALGTWTEFADLTDTIQITPGTTSYLWHDGYTSWSIEQRDGLGVTLNAVYKEDIDHHDATLTVPVDAPAGATFTVTCDGKTVTFQIIASNPTDTTKVLIAFRQADDIPPEPQATAGKYYHYKADGIVTLDRVYYMEINNGFVHEDQIWNSKDKLTSNDGKIYGIVDYTGSNKTLDYLEMTEEMMEDMVEEYIHTVLPNEDPTDYKLIVYVIKYQDSEWHIDCKVVEKNQYLLSYEYNPPKNFTAYDKVAGTMPSVQQIEASFDGTSVYGTIANGAGLKLQTKVDNATYTATFAGWNTDPNADPADAKEYSGGEKGWYKAGDQILMTGDITLYAIWDTDFTYVQSDIELHKVVVNENGTSADTDMENYLFTFTGNVPQEGYVYNLYNAAGIHEDDGKITDNPEGRQFVLKNGWSILIENVPNGVYTLTETPKEGYKASIFKDGVQTESKDWKINLDFVQNPDGEEIIYFYNIKLETYMITYMSDNSPVAISGLMTPGTETTLEDGNKFAKDGYIFQGWKCDVTDCAICGSGYHASSATYQMPKQHVEMAAQWKYQVKFDKNDGSQNPIMEEHVLGMNEQIDFPETPTRNGYAFLGWYDAPTGGNRLDSADGTAKYTATGPATVYAQWVDNRLNEEIGIGINLFYHCDAQYKYVGSGARTDSYHKYPNEPASLDHVVVRAYNENTTWEISGNYDVRLEGSARNYVQNSFFTSPDVVTAADGTIGLADPTGAKVKAILKLTKADYEAIVEKWIAWTKTSGFNTDTGYKDAWNNGAVSKEKNWADAKPDDYKAIPYVVKYQNSNGNMVWFIDIVIVPKEKYTLGYDRNLEHGYSLPSNQKFPETTTHNEGDTAYVVPDPSVTPTKTVNGTTYKATFLYWVDEDGNKYGSGYYTDSIVMWEDKILYAVWEYEDSPQFGKLRVTKKVTALDDDKPAPPNAVFNFTVWLTDKDGNQLTSDYAYDIYNGESVKMDAGNLGTGGSFQLQDRWYIIIADLPGGAKCEIREADVAGDYFRPVGMPKEREILVGNTARALVENVYAEIAENETWYTVEHYVQNSKGDYPTVPNDRDTLIGLKNGTTNAQPKTPQGYSLDKAKHPDNTVKQVTIAEDGSTVVKIYYARNLYPYVVYYREQGTNEDLLEKKTGNAFFSTSVTENAPEISGYTLVSPESLSCRIQAEEDETNVNYNIITFYYQEKQVTLNYQVVGDPGCGTLSIESETIGAKTGTALGSAPTAADGYKFTGWFLDKECTQPVKETWVTTDNRLEPQKDREQDVLLEAATYYARFERKSGSLEIQKMVTKNDPYALWNGDTFDFLVTGDVALADGTYRISVNEDEKELIVSGGKVEFQVSMDVNVLDVPLCLVIRDLPVGNYKITETESGDYHTVVNETEACEISVEVKDNEQTEVKFKNTYLTGSLTITKTNASDLEQVFVYQVGNSKGEMITVTVVGNGSTTIYGLPYDTYTIIQVNDWSWRYNDGKREILLNQENQTVSFDGTVVDDSWLDGCSPLIANRKREENSG